MVASTLTISQASFAGESTCPPIEYRIIDLHGFTNPPESIAYGINDIGEVVGDLLGTGTGAFVWLFIDNYGLSGKTMLDLTDIGMPNVPTGNFSASDINFDGTIVGTHEPNTGDHVAIWDLAENEYSSYEYTAPFGLGTFGKALKDGDPLTIVGTTVLADGTRRGFVVTFGDPFSTEHELSPVNSWNHSHASDLSNAGRIVGFSDGSDAGDCGLDLAPATLWDQPTTGVALEGMHDGEGSRWTTGVNDEHDIVGIVRYVESGPPDPVCYWRAAVWHPDSHDEYDEPVPLPFIGGPNSPEDTFARAIADPIIRDSMEELHVVGESAGFLTATLWRRIDDMWYADDLNEISCAEDIDFFDLRDATDINNLGWIVGWMDVDDGLEVEQHAYLAIPLDWCPGDLNLDGVVDGADLTLLLANWGECPDCCCLADLNRDGHVDGADQLILTGNWGTCPGFEHLEEPESFSSFLASAGLGNADWDQFVNAMSTGTETEKANHLCWMSNYLAQCESCPACPAGDPFTE